METSFAETANASTAYSVRGEGPPILLIHGAEATRSSFDGLARLLGHRMTVYSYDQRQCGETRSKADPASIADLVDDAAHLMEVLDLREPTVLGTSFGGRIAQGLAIRHPRLVRRLILCNTWPLDVALEAVNLSGVARLHALRTGLPRTARQLAEAYYGAEHVTAHPELVDRFAQRAGAGAGPRTALARSMEAMPAERIAAPTLLVSGSDDAVVPAHVMRGLHDRIKDSRWADVPGGHHAITVERPAEVARLIEEFVG